MKRIYIGADKSGFILKEAIKNYLISKDYEIIDLGMQDMDNPVPFYKAAVKVAKAVQKEDGNVKGILICGTGMGVSQIANKYKGIRAACVESTYAAKMSRAINDSNILCMGGWLIADVMGISIADMFLNTKFTQDLEEWRSEFLNKAKNELEIIEDEIYN